MAKGLLLVLSWNQPKNSRFAVQDQARGATYIKMWLLHQSWVTEHCGSSHVSKQELTDWVSFIVPVGILSQRFVRVVNWNSKKWDAAEHGAKRHQNVKKSIYSIPKDQIGVFLNCFFTFGHFNAKFFQHWMLQLVFERLLLWFEAPGQDWWDVMWFNWISQRVLVFNIHQSFVYLLPSKQCFLNLY